MSNFDAWKDKLENHESPVSSRVWNGVEMELVNSKKRKGGFLWFGGILILLLSAFIVYPSFDSQEGTEDKISEIQTKKVQQATSKLFPEKERIDAEKEETVEKIKSTASHEKSANVKLNPVGEIIPKSKNENIKSASKIYVESKIEIPVVQANQTGYLEQDPIQLIKKEEVEKNTNIPRKELRKTEHIELLEIKKIVVNYEQFSKIDRCDFPDPPIGCPDLNRKSGNRGLGLSKWVVDLTYGPGYAFRSLTDKGSESEDYINLRNANETAVYDQMIQARISYVSKWGITARTGINYGHLVEKLTYARDSIVRSTTTITIDTLFNTDGSFTITSDTINNSNLGRLDKVSFNHFKTFQVPIILGFEKRIKDWTFHVNGGVLMNFYLQRKGEILNTSDQPVDISTATGTFDAFKNDWGMLLYGSIGANYRIGERLHAVVEPSFRYTLKPITTTTYSLNQKYMIVNINLGLRYEF